jgi:hypothetical protein
MIFIRKKLDEAKNIKDKFYYSSLLVNKKKILI